MNYTIKFPTKDKLQSFITVHELDNYIADFDKRTLTLNSDTNNKAETALKASHFGGIVWSAGI